MYTRNGNENTGMDPSKFSFKMQEAGAGEIILNSVDRDGTYLGYDLTLIKIISSRLSIPVIACGGATNVEGFLPAVQSGASAVAAGSMFVYQKKGMGVLISFPTEGLKI